MKKLKQRSQDIYMKSCSPLDMAPILKPKSHHWSKFSHLSYGTGFHQSYMLIDISKVQGRSIICNKSQNYLSMDLLFISLKGNPASYTFFSYLSTNQKKATWCLNPTEADQAHIVIPTYYTVELIRIKGDLKELLIQAPHFPKKYVKF